MRLLITGASGLLGSNALLEARAAGRDVAGSYNGTPIRGEGVRAVAADLSRAGAPTELLTSLRPAWVLNCAALANVDACERDPYLARLTNVDLPRALAASCREAGVRLLHVSTDSVFDGSRGNYVENDETAPLNVYGQTKLDGEGAVLAELPDALVIRTNFFGLSPAGSTGLADWIITELSERRRISGFIDVRFSPLLANDLVRTMFAMMDAGLTGLYHAGATSDVSKHDFACLLAREFGFDETLIRPAKVADAGLGAPRPLDTSLCSSRLEAALGGRAPSVERSVARFAELRHSAYRGRLNALTGS